MKDSGGLNRGRLAISIVLSIIVWWFLYGSFPFAVILVLSILIHETGHYIRMGREGIKNRDMVMVPPLGAVAIAKDFWPSYAAEARIALAGPFYGFIPGGIFIILGNITSNKMWYASAFLVGLINLFNLLPVIPLDGGRCYRAILFSIHPQLRFLPVVIFGFALVLLALNGAYIVVFVIAYFGYREEIGYWRAKRNISLVKVEKTGEHIELSIPSENLEKIREKYPDEENLEEWLKNEVLLSFELLSIRRMNWREIAISTTEYIGLILIHASLVGVAAMELSLGTSPAGLLSYF